MSAISATTCVALLATIGFAFAAPVDESALREYARQNRADRVGGVSAAAAAALPGFTNATIGLAKSVRQSTLGRLMCLPSPSDGPRPPT
jgi:hypothetical protein